MAFRQRVLQPKTIIALLVGGAFLARLYFILNHQGMWGVDGGAYLLSRNSVLGDEPTGTDFPRPPLAPGWLLVPFTYLFGDNYGLRYFALLFSFAVLPPFLLLSKRLLTPWQQVFAVFLLLVDWNLAEMFTAGVLPMVGFGFLLLGIWALCLLKDGGDRRATLALFLCLPGIVYTNQTTVALAALALPAFVIGLGLNMGFLKRITLPVVVGIGLALTAWPWYMAVAPGSAQLRYPGPLAAFYSFQNAGWGLLLLAVIVGMILLSLFKVHGTYRGLAFIILAFSIFMPLRSYDETIQNIFYRARYLLMLPTTISVVWIASQWLKAPWPSWWRLAVKTSIIGLIPVFLGGYVFQLHAETKLGRMVTPETAEAIKWVNSQPERGTIVTNSYSLSLYVAALTKQKTAWTQIWDPPPAYVEQHRNASILLGWDAGDPGQAARNLDATYILVETLWPAWGKAVGLNTPGLGGTYAIVKKVSPWGDPDLGYIFKLPRNVNPWDITQQASWLELVWEKGSTKVWRVKL